ncbi:hypothetical protein [Streptomyces reticuliscabiei]|uniref:hypothetical protein n=1 Tax=Streptomyces reticuliscabiei TaxID=146821 RepID=UPI001180F3A1|nr:hypothetical protein [Streptomyces reticuliscabiei]
MRDVTAVSAAAGWLLLVGLAVVGLMVVLADGRLRWYPTSLLHWFMVIGLAQGPYGLLLASGLIPQAETPAVRMVMLPVWLLGIAFAVWRGRRAVLGIWADRQLIRILGDLNALPRVTALHRRAEGADERESLLQQARTALQRRRGRVALVSLEKALEQMKADHVTNDEWSDLRSRIRALATNFVGESRTSGPSPVA